MFGPHVNRDYATGTRPGLTSHIAMAQVDAYDQAKFHMRAAAVFVGGPKTREITLAPEERGALRSYISESHMKVIAHSAYSAHPWKGDPDAARYIVEELKVCQESGITGLVVHLPKLPASSVMKYIERLQSPDVENVRVYLETPAVKPSESYYETPTKLANLFSKIRTVDPGLDRFGLCFDTAHLWTCGVDLASYDAANDWLVDLEAHSRVIGPDATMIHLNDSERERGVGPDTHSGLTKGRIWSEYASNLPASGLAAVVDYAKRHDTPTILERKPREALIDDYHLLMRL